MTLSLTEILAQAENPEFVRVKTAYVLLRQDLANELEDLTYQLQRALKEDAIENREPLAPGLSEQVQQFEARVEAELVPFKFRSIGRRAWADLLKEHPPTPEQIRENPKGIDHNTETFPIAALAASSVEPKMDYAAVERLDKALNDTQFTKLWVACLDANKGIEPPKSAAAGLILRAKGKFGGTVVDTGSLDQSSSDANSPVEASL